MNAFAYDPVGANNGVRSLLTLNGDKVTTPVTSDQWKEGLKYIHGLYKDGLIDQAAFTQNAQALQAQGNNPKAVVLGSVPVLWPGIFVQLDSKDGRDKQYDAVPPLTGPEGKSYTGYNHPTSTGYTFMLTNKASKEAQVAAIKMLDWIYSDEGQMITNMGPEGVGWTKPAAGDIALDASTKALYKPKQDAPKNISWGALGAVQQHAGLPERAGRAEGHLHRRRPGAAAVGGDQAVRGPRGQGAVVPVDRSSGRTRA